MSLSETFIFNLLVKLKIFVVRFSQGLSSLKKFSNHHILSVIRLSLISMSYCIYRWFKPLSVDQLHIFMLGL